jgi:ribosomal-protein-alanine N-acetyltransferase
MIRFACGDDLALIIEAEKQCFSGDPWGDNTVASMITDENVGFALYFPDDDEKMLAAYLVYSKTNPIELYKIAVLPSQRKKGLGTFLMNTLISVAAESEEKRIVLEVREGNTAAISLYEKFGFKRDCIRKSYYKNPTENAILMSLDLNERQ